jgi:hypothetical protein
VHCTKARNDPHVAQGNWQEWSEQHVLLATEPKADVDVNHEAWNNGKALDRLW